MKIYAYGGNVDFKLNNYPDSQRLLSLNTNIPQDSFIKITQSVTSFADLELVINAVAAIKNKYGNKPTITWYCPYFLGARSDRQFETRGVHYLRDVICPIVNSLELDRVEFLDPHSDVLPSLVKNSFVIDNKELIMKAIKDFSLLSGKKITLVAPDGSAEKKLYNTVSKIYKVNSHLEIIGCSKHRDVETGRITGYKIPEFDYEGRVLLAVDDICDGGRTFVELAKALKGKEYKSLNLLVTHGIFSAGFDELFANFDHIYTTNSYKDWNIPELSDKLTCWDVQ